MRINGIKPVCTRNHKATTNSNHSLGIAPNILDGDFAADTPNRKWAGNITYTAMSEKVTVARDRPITNEIDPIPASPEEVAMAIFRAADKKTKKPKLKPN